MKVIKNREKNVMHINVTHEEMTTEQSVMEMIEMTTKLIQTYIKNMVEHSRVG